MRFSVFTHVVHKKKAGKVFAYSPYIREMNLWISEASEVRIIAPVDYGQPGPIDTSYNHHNLKLQRVPFLYFKSFFSLIRSLVMMIPAGIIIFREMKTAEHIHIRCPGNIGLIACVIQIFFPGKKKTVKYAGNWDPKSRQPWSYDLQKKILNSTFLSRNIEVLVYGKWSYSSKNIVPFYTASYSNKEAKKITKDFSAPYKFIFLGALAEGKRPLLAVEVIHKLICDGYNVFLDMFGDGDKVADIRDYINDNDLNDRIKLYGNQNAGVIKKVLKETHFVILLSRSEGWPKALAEGMFFGAIPIATEVSCIPWMLHNGNRGILVNPELECAIKSISEAMEDRQKLICMSQRAQEWAQRYTMEKFQKAVQEFV